MMFTFLQARRASRPAARWSRRTASTLARERARDDAARAASSWCCPSTASPRPRRRLGARARHRASSALRRRRDGRRHRPRDRAAHSRESCATRSTVLWNGPMGIFEVPAFAAGTLGVARVLRRGRRTRRDGRSWAAATRSRRCSRPGSRERFTHLSTGGGASLEFLEGKVLPGVAALDDAERVSRTTVAAPAAPRRAATGRCTRPPPRARALARELRRAARRAPAVRGRAVPAVHRARVGGRGAARRHGIALGAQNLHCGAAGRVHRRGVGRRCSRRSGCRLVIVGHSERRHGMGEDDASVARKLRAALRDEPDADRVRGRDARRARGRPHRRGARAPDPGRLRRARRRRRAARR